MSESGRDLASNRLGQGRRLVGLRRDVAGLAHQAHRPPFAAAVLVGAIMLGCSPSAPGPAVPPGPVRAAPPAAGRPERPRSSPGSPGLQRFADAGAWVLAEMTGKGWCQPDTGATAIMFKDQVVEKNMLEGLAQVRSPAFLFFERVEFGRGALSPLDGARSLYGLHIHNAGNELMMDIATTPELRELWATGVNATSRGLRFLATANKLCDLNLAGADVGDDIVASVSALSGLRKLGLSGTRVTDAGLPLLSGLQRLDDLALDDCPLTDEGVRHLSKLRGLRSLNLSNTRITDASLSYVAQLKSLEYLRLDGTAVTDDGLSRLAPLNNLLVLTVSDTSISDDGLPHLRQMRSLTGVSAFHTRVTERGKRLLPQIEYSASDEGGGR